MSAGFSSWESAALHLGDANASLLAYYDNLREDMTALEKKVDKSEEFYRDKYTEANEAYLSEARRAKDAEEEVRTLAAERTDLRRQIERLEAQQSEMLKELIFHQRRSVASSDDDWKLTTG